MTIARVENATTIVTDRGETIRLLGVQPIDNTTELTTSFVQNETVKLTFDTKQKDENGQTLAYVWITGCIEGDCGEHLLNKVLLQQGHATTSDDSIRRDYREQFENEQTKAKLRRQGVLKLTTSEVTNRAVSSTVSFNTQSKKYHCPTCTAAKRCTKNCVSTTLADAQARGGTACRLCSGSCN